MSDVVYDLFVRDSKPGDVIELEYDKSTYTVISSEIDPKTDSKLVNNQYGLLTDLACEARCRRLDWAGFLDKPVLIDI